MEQGLIQPGKSYPPFWLARLKRALWVALSYPPSAVVSAPFNAIFNHNLVPCEHRDHERLFKRFCKLDQTLLLDNLFAYEIALSHLERFLGHLAGCPHCRVRCIYSDIDDHHQIAGSR